MSRQLVFKIGNVAGFSPDEAGGAFVSRLLIDPDGVGSSSLVVNHFTLRPGRTTGDRGHHPPPYDEVYIVLRGQGRLQLGEPPEIHALEPDTVVFIPGGTAHAVANTGEANLELLTIMPGPLREGVNSVYDSRRKAWGKGFKLITGGDGTT
jgi:mannose-6-phosphate isomerase-like protein (cupin superfamily)